MRRKAWKYETNQRRFAYVLLAPAMAAIILFIAYPVVQSFLLTFSRFTIKGIKWFAEGFGNYHTVFQDRDFRNSVVFTLLYTALYVPLSVAAALFVGVILQQSRIATGFFRSILFLPTVIPMTMGYLMFQWILDPQNGILNYLLRDVLGLPGLAMNWLSDSSTVAGSLIAITLWGFGPWIMMLAGLMAIPKDFYEAARVDGVNRLQEFFHITLPLLRNTLVVVVTLQLIRALKVFVPIYILTSGGPAGASKSLYYLVFEKVSQNKLSYATTVGWVFTFIVLIISIVVPIAFRNRDSGD